MRITTKGRYALSAIAALALNSIDDDPVSIRSLAESEGISADFLEQIFFKLRRSGIVNSVRGPGGGFRLARPSREISLHEILSAVGERIAISPPTLSLDGKRGLASKPAAPNGRGGRKAGAALRELEEEVKRFASEKSLADIVGTGRRRQ